MSKVTTCDRCQIQPAITEAEFKTTTTTTIKMDLCETCLADIKKIFRSFTKQDVIDLDVVIAETQIGQG